MLDAYIIIIILYKNPLLSPAAFKVQLKQQHLPFPPPQASAIAKTVSGIRQNRRICPKVAGFSRVSRVQL
jgi:C4-dicarboxylate transporter